MNDAKSSISTKWLSFYTYGLLPFYVFTGFVSILVEYDKLVEAGYNVTLTFRHFFPPIIGGIFTLVVLYGLHKRKMWGWTINWVYLFAIVLSSPLVHTREIGAYLVAVFLLGLVFLLPNLIYFRKRQVLFQATENVADIPNHSPVSSVSAVPAASNFSNDSPRDERSQGTMTLPPPKTNTPAGNLSKPGPTEINCTVQLQTVVDEDRVYAEIAKELETGTADKGLWTRLFAECDGDEKRTKVAYIKQRAVKLIAAESLRLKQAACARAAKSDAEQMEEYGITFDGGRYTYKDYIYDRLFDAINYAKLQKARSK
jgi:hypothetical protein